MADMQDEESFRVSSQLDGEPCEVYFFKRWTGYSHPVRPMDPIRYEEALKSQSFCRVFLRRIQASEHIVLFQSITAVRTPLNIQIPSAEGDRFFEVDRNQAPPDVGQSVPPTRAVMIDEFIHISPGQKTPGSAPHVELIINAIEYSYRYKYKATGALQQVVITNPDRQSVLDY